MNKFIDEDELEGRTIEKCISSSSEILLSFTDGTYTNICKSQGWYGETDIGFEEPTEYELVQLEILSKREYDEMEKTRRLAAELRNKKDKEALYERLKKELGK